MMRLESGGMPYLTVLTPDADRGRRIPLDKGYLAVGREPTCDVRFDDRRVSRKHAALRRHGDAVYVQDLHSYGGTFVNGEFVATARELHAGDVLTFASVTARLEYDGAVADGTGIMPAGPAGAPAHRASRPEILPLRWWNRMTKIILGAGALATAIAAVMALLPSPDRQNVARFISVQMLAQVPLNEFQQRSAVFQAQPAGHPHQHRPRLMVAVIGRSSPPSAQDGATTTPLPSSSDTTAPPTSEAPPTGTAPPAVTVPPTGPPSPSPTGWTTPAGTGPAPGAVKLMLPAGLSLYGADSYAARVAFLVRETGSLLPGPSAQVLRILAPVVAKENGQLVPPHVAARRLIGLLGHTRTVSEVSSQGGVRGSKRMPLGELVSVNLELAGLRGRPVFLSWSIFQRGGRAHLFGKWLSNFVAYRLQATTDDDTGTVQMWIPLPRVPGPYFLHLSLATGGASLASTDSGLFG